MIRVQNQQHVEGTDQRRINVVGLVGHAEGHANEVFGVATLAVRVQQGQTCRALRDVRNHRRHLGDEEDEGAVQLLGIVGIQGLLIVGGQAGSTGLEDRHGVPVVGEGSKEGLEILME